MKIEIDATRIDISRSQHGMDILCIQTTLPNGVWPHDGHGTLVLYTGKDSGEAYCAANFPGVPFVVAIRD